MLGLYRKNRKEIGNYHIIIQYVGAINRGGALGDYSIGFQDQRLQGLRFWCWGLGV